MRRSAASYAEFHEQVLFAKRCDLHPAVRRHVYTATMTGVNLGVRAATQAKAKGVKKGVPDWMLYAHGRSTAGEWICHGLALEFKSPTGKGKLKPEQIGWATGLRLEGWRVEHPRTAREAWEILCHYLGISDQ